MKKQTRTIYSILIFVVLMSFFGVGCNTIEGIGQDIKAAGNAIENAASN